LDAASGAGSAGAGSAGAGLAGAGSAGVELAGVESVGADGPHAATLITISKATHRAKIGLIFFIDCSSIK